MVCIGETAGAERGQRTSQQTPAKYVVFLVYIFHQGRARFHGFGFLKALSLSPMSGGVKGDDDNV